MPTAYPHTHTRTYIQCVSGGTRNTDNTRSHVYLCCCRVCLKLLAVFSLHLPASFRRDVFMTSERKTLFAPDGPFRESLFPLPLELLTAHEENGTVDTSVLRAYPRAEWSSASPSIRKARDATPCHAMPTHITQHDAAPSHTAHSLTLRNASFTEQLAPPSLYCCSTDVSVGERAWFFQHYNTTLEPPLHRTRAHVRKTTEFRISSRAPMEHHFMSESPAREYLEQVKCCHDTDCNESMMKKGFTALKMERGKNTQKPSGKR